MWKEGGSRRVARRRPDRIPERLPLVGERPAGAGGQDLGVFSTLALPKLDLTFKMRRGVVAALLGLARDRALAAGVLSLGVRKKLDGLVRLSLAGVAAPPLERFAKSSGSTFSQLSISRNSALRLGETEAASS
jgi:hypothetical protein